MLLAMRHWYLLPNNVHEILSPNLTESPSPINNPPLTHAQPQRSLE